MNIDDKQPTGADSERPMTLIERLEKERNAKSRLADYYKTVALEQFVGGLEQAIAIVKQHNEWVSVNERLPDIGQRVLTQKGGYVTICSLYRRGQGKMRWNDGRRLSDLEHYTHWMPIPQPPSKAQDD